MKIIHVFEQFEHEGDLYTRMTWSNDQGQTGVKWLGGEDALQISHGTVILNKDKFKRLENEYKDANKTICLDPSEPS